MSKIGDAGMSDFETVPIGTKAELKRLVTIEIALVDLVRLKAFKDKHGKTPEYLVQQPIVWASAREALADE